jgi:hypothetical protein
MDNHDDAPARAAPAPRELEAGTPGRAQSMDAAADDNAVDGAWKLAH